MRKLLAIVFVFGLWLTFMTRVEANNSDDGTEVKFKDLPISVKLTMMKTADGNWIRKITKDKRYYDALVSQDKKGNDLEIKVRTGGTLYSIEEKVSLKEVPEAVAKTIKGSGFIVNHKIKNLVKIKRGDILFYEIQVKGRDKKKTYVSPEGTILTKEP